jgi:predicted metal-binding membrane protein
VTASTLERAAWRHPEWTAGALAFSAWAVLVFGQSGGHSHNGHGSGSSPAGWLLMVTAMMVPAGLPAMRHAALTTLWHRRHRVVALFLASYLGLWLVFGLVAVAIVGRAATGGIALAVALLIAAGWELTPWKRRSLRAGHLFPALPHRALRADLACLRAGLRYGLWSLVGCWPLMLAMAIAGSGALLVMVLLTFVIAAREVLVRGTRLGRPAAAALFAAAVVVMAA